ncbi:MAG: hypothetical protein IT424_10800 [Pirellulales bacterium]|nr:hypothetical protein [Pirellulales bacterium]
MALTWEKWYPILIASAVTAIYLSVPALRQYALPPTASALMAAIVSIGGIAIGFLATAKSILVSIDDREIIQKLKSSGYYKRIIAYLRTAIRWSFLLTGYSAAALLVEFGPATSWSFSYSVGFSVWLLLATASALSYYRVINIFYAVLESLS